MNNSQEILDDPLENSTSLLAPSRLAVVSSKLDFGINVLLLAAWVLTGLAALAENDMAFVLAMIHFVMGCYQLLSTMISAMRGQRPKLYYFIAVLAYLLVLILASYFSGLGFGDLFMYLFVGFFPLIGAIYYTKLSYDTKQKILAYD